MDTRSDLIICIGNVARGDDGVAHRVAALLRNALPATARIVTAPDLDVAMAADLAVASRLVLVDAERREEPAVSHRALEPGPSPRATGHGIDPQGLLGLTKALYGAVPVTTLWSVAGPEMGHGEALSPTAEAAAQEAAAVIAQYLESERAR